MLFINFSIIEFYGCKNGWMKESSQPNQFSNIDMFSWCFIFMFPMIWHRFDANYLRVNEQTQGSNIH